MSRSPSEIGSIHTSKSTSPHEDEATRQYDQLVISRLDDDPVFSLLPSTTVFEDGKTISEVIGFDPTSHMDALKRSYRKYATMDGVEMHFSVFSRIEKGTEDKFVSKYMRDLNAEIRNTTGRKRHERYDDMVVRYKEKVSRKYYHAPRKSAKDDFVASSREPGVHATRSKIVDDSTEQSDAADKAKEPEIEPASVQMLKIAAAKARKELKETAPTRIQESEQESEDDFVDTTKKTKPASRRQSPRKRSTTKAPDVAPSTSAAAAKGGKGKGTPAKSGRGRGRARLTPLKISPLHIVTVPSVRSSRTVEKKKLEPPKNPPRTNKRSRNDSPESVSSSAGTPAKNPRTTEEPDTIEAEGPPIIDATFGVRSPRSGPSAENAQLLTTFAEVHQEDESANEAHRTFRGSPTSDEGQVAGTIEKMAAGTSTARASPRIAGGSFGEFMKFLEERDKKMKEFIESENKKIARRQYKLYAAMKELKEEQKAMKKSYNDIVSSNGKIYDRLKLVGDQAAERKGAVASSLLSFFPLDLIGEFGDILLACSYIHKHLPPLIAKQIDLQKHKDVNKSIGNGVMHFLFGPFPLSHLLLGDSKGSIRALKVINRPIPEGVIKVIIPAVLEILKKKVTIAGKDTNESVKIIRGGFSDLFHNTKTTYIGHIYNMSKNMDDVFRSLYVGDRVFFEANKHCFPPGTKFATPEEHRAAMLNRDKLKDQLELELNGLRKKEKKVKFLPPQEAVMSLRVNVGADQMSAKEVIGQIIDIARDNGDKYHNFKFSNDCQVKNVDAIYKAVLQEKKEEYKRGTLLPVDRAAMSPDEVGPQTNVFGETSPPVASTSSARRGSVRELIKERKEAHHFPDRKATTSSSNDAMVIDTGDEAEEEVFENKEKAKKKRRRVEKGKKVKKAADIDEETSDEDDIEMSSGETSEEGEDDILIRQELDGNSDDEAGQETEAEKETADEPRGKDTEAEHDIPTAEHEGQLEGQDASEKERESNNNDEITAEAPSNPSSAQSDIDTPPAVGGED